MCVHRIMKVPATNVRLLSFLVVFSCVILGNSATTSCSEADICLQPNQAEDYSLFTEVSGHAEVFAHILKLYFHILICFFLILFPGVICSLSGFLPSSV